MGATSRIRNPFVQQYLLELLFPLLGYYLFDWGILIIGLFYLVDYLAAILSFARRGRLVNKHSGSKVSPIFAGLIIVSLIIFFFVVSYTFAWYLRQMYNLSETELLIEVKAAFISELWIIIPLVVFITIFKDRFTFIMPRRYLNFDPKRYFLAALILNGILVLLVLVFVFLTLQFNCPETALIPIFLVGKIGFDQMDVKWLKKWSLNR